MLLIIPTLSLVLTSWHLITKSESPPLYLISELQVLFAWLVGFLCLSLLKGHAHEEESVFPSLCDHLTSEQILACVPDARMRHPAQAHTRVLVFLPLGGLLRWVSMSGNATHLKLCCSFGHYCLQQKDLVGISHTDQPLPVKKKWRSYYHQKHYPDRAWYFKDRRDESGRDRERGCAERFFNE